MASSAENTGCQPRRAFPFITLVTFPAASSIFTDLSDTT